MFEMTMYHIMVKIMQSRGVDSGDMLLVVEEVGVGVGEDIMTIYLNSHFCSCSLLFIIYLTCLHADGKLIIIASTLLKTRNL